MKRYLVSKRIIAGYVHMNALPKKKAARIQTILDLLWNGLLDEDTAKSLLQF